MTEKRGVIAVKRSIIRKTAPLAYLRGRLSRGKHLLRHKKPLFHYVLFGGLVQFLLKKTEKITFADEKVTCDLLDTLDRTKVFVGVLKRLGDQRRERGETVQQEY